MIHSGLKWRSQKKMLFASMRFFKSAVASRVLNRRRSHSSRAVFFNAAVSSPSAAPTTGILKSERPSCLLLVEHPYNAQFWPTISQNYRFKAWLQYYSSEDVSLGQTRSKNRRYLIRILRQQYNLSTLYTASVPVYRHVTRIKSGQ